MGLLGTAVEQGRWEVAAYCLLLGAVRALSRLPQGSLEELVALLEEPRGPQAQG